MSGNQHFNGVHAYVLSQLCWTLCDHMDCSLPGSPVHGILQARILEWGVIPFFRGIFPTQGLNPHLLCLLHWHAGSLPLVPPGKPHPERSRSKDHSTHGYAFIIIIVVSFLPFMDLLKNFLSYIGIEPINREGDGNPLQYSCLENPMGRGACWTAVHGVAKSRARLSDFTFTFYFHALEKEMASHSSVLAWRISGTEEPGGLPSMGLHRVGHDWSDLAAAEPINNVVTVLGVQQRDSARHVHVSILPQTSLPSRLPLNIEQSSLCWAVGPCWFYFKYTSVYLSIPKSLTIPLSVLIFSFFLKRIF